MQDSAKIAVKTRKPFYGHIYVKGQYRLPECHLDLTDGQGGQIPQPNPYNLYNIQSKRSQTNVGSGVASLINIEFFVSYRSCYVKRERSVSLYFSTWTTHPKITPN